MTKNIVLTVDTVEEHCRLDLYLSESELFSSRSQVQNLIKQGAVKVNGKNEKSSFIIKNGDEIEITVNEECSPVILPENILLDIRYEDDDILVVNKPKNMLTHPTPKETSGTLVNALLYKYGYEGLSSLNGVMRPGIVHRLDRNTSGLLMIAKNNEAHEYLAERIKSKEIKRQYFAVVFGNFDTETGSIDAPLGRNPNKPEKFTVREDGKNAVTHYKVLEQYKGYSFIELTLETGRTHQIRAHMSYINHPIVNDSLYCGAQFKIKTTEQVLQSYKLRFTPLKKDDIIEIELLPDDDLTRVLNYLRSLK